MWVRSLVQLMVDVVSIQRYVEPGRTWLLKESDSFWVACAFWLLPRGYKLYTSSRPDSIPIPSARSDRIFPYSLTYGTYESVWCLYNYSPRDLFALGHNSQDHQVVIRVVAKKSHEWKIYNTLHQSSELYDICGYPSLIPPIEIITTGRNFDFVILPRWGIDPLFKDPDAQNPFTTVSEALHFISSMLNGLRFLHSRRIVHRDLKPANTLVNLLDYNQYHAPPSILCELRAGLYSEPVQYCLMDFNLSVIFPLELPLEDCRLTSRIISHGTTWYAPPSLEWSNLVYDPFAYDVACLGGIFVRHLSYMIPQVPLLAPLFDRMITHVMTERFTAAEAYEFSQMIQKSLSQDDLGISMPPHVTNSVLKTPWESLDRSFMRIWAPYRTPSFTFFEKVLFWVGEYSAGFRLIRFFRLWFQFRGRYPSFYPTEYEL